MPTGSKTRAIAHKAKTTTKYWKTEIEASNRQKPCTRSIANRFKWEHAARSAKRNFIRRGRNWQLKIEKETWTLNIVNINGQQNLIPEHFALRTENWKCIEIDEAEQKLKWNAYTSTQSIQSEWFWKIEEQKQKPEANITLYVNVWLFNFNSESYVKLFILKMYNYCNCIKESVVYAICWALCTLCALCACSFYRFLYFLVAFNDFDIKTV